MPRHPEDRGAEVRRHALSDDPENMIFMVFPNKTKCFRYVFPEIEVSSEETKRDL